MSNIIPYYFCGESGLPRIHNWGIILCMDPFVIVEETHSKIRKGITMIILILIIAISAVYDYKKISLYNSKVEIVETAPIETRLSKEEILKRENLATLSKFSAENPVSTSTKENLLNVLNKLNAENNKK